MDKDLIFAKAGLVQKHLKRIEMKIGDDLDAFLKDPDKQDIVAFNFHAAIQNCIDIAAHVVSEKSLGLPGSFSEMFYLLEENGLISQPTCEHMIKATGLRNLLVHEYGKLDLKRVYESPGNT